MKDQVNLEAEIGIMLPQTKQHLPLPEAGRAIILPRALVEKATAPYSSTLAWRIPWTEEPGRLQSTGLLRVRHD